MVAGIAGSIGTFATGLAGWLALSRQYEEQVVYRTINKLDKLRASLKDAEPRSIGPDAGNLEGDDAAMLEVSDASSGLGRSIGATSLKKNIDLAKKQ